MQVTTLHSDGTQTTEEVDSPEIRAALADMKAAYGKFDWCECGPNGTFGCYPGDGECSCGMHKHHVHCGVCGKVSQIG